MGDREQDQYIYECNVLVARLDHAIDVLMHYIFEGRCKDKSFWEQLIRAVNQAVFIKEQLDSCRGNMLTLAETFLDSFQEWYKGLYDLVK